MKNKVSAYSINYKYFRTIIYKRNNKLFKIIILSFFFIFEFKINYKKIQLNFINTNINETNLTYFEIDNEFPLFENNIDFSNYSTNIKTIALYLPQFHFIEENNKWWGKNFTEWTNVKKAIPFYKGHHQPRKPGDEKGYLGYYYLTNADIIKKQVKLAKSHGIYGFGIYYYWFSGKKLLEKPLDIYLENKDINFPFLLIWANENWSRKWNGGDQSILIKQEYKENDPEDFIKDIKKYLVDQRYIKINNKSIIGIYEPFKIPNLTETISIWRKKAIEIEIGEIYILISLNSYKIKNIKNLKLFDAAYDFPPRINNLLKPNTLYYYYEALIYKNIQFDNYIKNFPVFRGNMLEWDNTPRKGKSGAIFKEYSPEKFYLLNKKLIEWTKNNYNQEYRFFFINAWNEWGEGSYLEPDDKYGYASINALSKSLFNLSYSFINFNYSDYEKVSRIVVIVDIYYDKIINEIINKTNNIPVRFDLVIYTNTIKIIKEIEKYVKKNTRASQYLIINYESKYKNKLLFSKYFKKYRYICYIYGENSNNSKSLESWRNYLYNNLLGSKEIISEILSNFDSFNNLGIIFPEVYYLCSKNKEQFINETDKIYINNILNKIFQNNKISLGKIKFSPIEYMFWVKIDAIYQIFDGKFVIRYYKYHNSLIILLLYLTKLNGYYYKKIFKHF